MSKENEIVGVDKSTEAIEVSPLGEQAGNGEQSDNKNLDNPDVVVRGNQGGDNDKNDNTGKDNSNSVNSDQQIGKLVSVFGEHRKAISKALLSNDPNEAMVEALQKDPTLAKYFEKKYKVSIDHFAKTGEVPKLDGDNNTGESTKVDVLKVARAINSNIDNAEMIKSVNKVAQDRKFTTIEAVEIKKFADDLRKTRKGMSIEQALNTSILSIHGTIQSKKQIPLSRGGSKAIAKKLDDDLNYEEYVKKHDLA